MFFAGVLGKVHTWTLGHGRILPIEEAGKSKFRVFLFFEVILQRKIFQYCP